jgi:septal ring factor EnvC (AmiA/AmiB activator)
VVWRAPYDSANLYFVLLIPARYNRGMTISDDNYLGVLLEEIRDQNRAVLEAVGDMQKNVAKLPSIETDIRELKQDMKVVKATVTDLSHQVNDHEHRITRLEAAS